MKVSLKNIDKVPTFGALVAYEKETGGNAFELLQKKSKSATDLRWLVWMSLLPDNPNLKVDEIDIVLDAPAKE